jgi:hypothetical protein
MPAIYDLYDLQPLLPFTATDDGAPFPWQASAGGEHVLYLADDKGLWLRVPDEHDEAMDFEAVTGFRHIELDRKNAGGIYIYALKGGAPLLPFPFTAAQLVELDRRTGGVFSEGIYCGDETDELIAELPPKSAELARAVVYGELPPEQDATSAPVAKPAPAQPNTEKAEPEAETEPQVVPVVQAAAHPATALPETPMSRAGLIKAHEHHWPTIKADLGDAARNGLSVAKAGKRGWVESKALEWARAKGNLTDS